MSDFSNLVSLYNAILNYVQQRGLEDYDDFSWKLTEKILVQFSRGNFNVEKMIKGISTRFFKMNNIKREEFFSISFSTLVIGKWKEPKALRYPLLGTDKQAIFQLTRIQKQRGSYKQIFVDEIDSFKEIRKVSAESAAMMVPLKVKEREIKAWLAKIVDEPFTQKDWGGEPSDLYSNRVKLGGKRVPTAFLLKGPGVKGTLTAAKCGKNGDQILRLVKAYSARLFIVQFVGKIHPNLVDTLEAHVAYESMKGKKIMFCVIDGVDTARIFLAYGQMKA